MAEEEKYKQITYMDMKKIESCMLWHGNQVLKELQVY